MADPKVIVGVPDYPTAGIRSLGTGEKLNEANITRLVTDLANGLEAVKQTAESSGDVVKAQLFPAKAAATGNVALSGTGTFDGVPCAFGDTVFLPAQTNKSQNGPWVLGSPWQRPADFDSSSKVKSGQRIGITLGASWGGREFQLSSVGPFTLGTTDLVWDPVGTGGAGAGTIQPVHAVASSNVSLSAPGAVIGGVTMDSSHNRVLLPFQTAGAENGVYLWTGAGVPLTRTADCDADSDLVLGQTIYVTSDKSRWKLTAATTITAAKTYELIPDRPVKSGRDGVLPALTAAHGVPVANSDFSAIVHSVEGVRVKAFEAITANDNAAIQAATSLARTLHCAVIFEARDYTGLSYIDCELAQGVHWIGKGGMCLSGTGGTTLRFDSAPADVPGTSATSNAIGAVSTSATSNPITAGVNKTFAVAAGLFLPAGTQVTMTATAGATGSITGLVVSYSGTTLVMTADSVTGSGTGTAWSLSSPLRRFTINASGLYLTRGAPIVLTATAGTTGTITATVYDYSGTTLDVSVLSTTGSGTGTAWSFVAKPRPLVNFRSALGCGIHGMNIRVNFAGFKGRVLDTSWALSIADTNSFHCEQVYISGTTGTSTREFWAFFFGTTQALECINCYSDGAYVGFFAGNGPSAFRGCTVTNWSYRAMLVQSAEQTIDNCVFEPGTALDGVTQIIDGLECGPNGIGTVSITNNIFNDAGASATGYWIRANSMRAVDIRSNTIQSDATQAPILVTSSEATVIEANTFLTSKIVEVAALPASTSGTIKIGVNAYLGTTPVVGSNVGDLIQERVATRKVPGSLGLKRNFADFYAVVSDSGVLVPGTGVDFSTGVDISLQSTNVYNTWAGGPALFRSAYAFDDGLTLDIAHTQAQTFTLVNNYTGTINGSKKLLTLTGADIVLPAASSANPIKIRLRYYLSIDYWVLESISPACLHWLTKRVDSNSGAALTLKLASSALQRVSLTANTTVTVTPPAAPAWGFLEVVQGASNWTLAWSGVIWAGAAAPTPSPGSGVKDLYQWMYDGSDTYMWRVSAAAA